MPTLYWGPWLAKIRRGSPEYVPSNYYSCRAKKYYFSNVFRISTNFFTFSIFRFTIKNTYNTNSDGIHHHTQKMNDINKSSIKHKLWTSLSEYSIIEIDRFWQIIFCFLSIIHEPLKMADISKKSQQCVWLIKKLKSIHN